MKNSEISYQVLSLLLESGVAEFCLCAGARNSPFVDLLEKNQQIKTYHFFEERSAAFFALGRIAESGRPVAVITTSGTAVAELLPAAVEATYSSLPLVLLTADRPQRYRGSGAPQAIEQSGIFSHYTEKEFDLDRKTAALFFAETKNIFSILSGQKPVHFNVCFEEPLIDGEAARLPESQPFVKRQMTDVAASADVVASAVERLESFVSKTKPLVLLGRIPCVDQKNVLSFLKKLQMPIYAESLSGLRGHTDLQDFEVRSGEKMLQRLFLEGCVNSVLRIGAVPTVRIWRDLEEKLKSIPVFSVSDNEYTGLSRQVEHFSALQIFEKVIISNGDNSKWKKVIHYDRSQQAVLLALMEKYPQAEPSLIYQLSKKIGSQSVYLGNSLPIREWDLCANYHQPSTRIGANRGANGIDGQISSFLGWCREGQENWSLVGDLTTLYDLSAPWISNQLGKSAKRIVIINNGGGMIFNRMFKNEFFLNRHNLDFSHWAQMWSWSYAQWSRIPETIQLADHQIIELKVCAQQTTDFWHDWDLAWK